MYICRFFYFVIAGYKERYDDLRKIKIIFKKVKNILIPQIIYK